MNAVFLLFFRHKSIAIKFRKLIGESGGKGVKKQKSYSRGAEATGCKAATNE